MLCYDFLMKNTILDMAVTATDAYIAAMTKEERKQYGQFFTGRETARFMAGLFDIPDNSSISVLDAGAGSGILSCALLERLDNKKSVKSVSLTCYETDARVLGLLRDNLEFCKSHMKIPLSYKIVTDNYITSQYLEFNGLIGADPNPDKFDLVIGNPPYMKVPRNAPEAEAMPEICHGAPNLYFLFAAMGMFNLKDGGEMVYIIPRSWTSGAYFKHFREYFLTNGKLMSVHLFGSRNKVFDAETVLQETIIIKAKKTNKALRNITITSSASGVDFSDVTSVTLPYDFVVSGPEKYVYLVTTPQEAEVLSKIQRFTHTLPDIGLRMKTGLTVGFRSYDELRDTDEDGAVPLFYAQHIKNGRVCFPAGKELEYIVTDRTSLTQENENYLFVKRFTAKEEPRRLQSGVYLTKDFPQYKKISTDNKINFISGTFVEMTDEAVYGLYVLFNSSLYDDYYRILNGSTQVNSTEVNAMPVPELKAIENMGLELMKNDDMSQENCDRILEVCCGKD